uniref:Triacylglycerol lipase n=1 Tax=Ditylenchus dipsaci TaxID=166011 RepID=A0A915CXV6_9BILA
MDTQLSGNWLVMISCQQEVWWWDAHSWRADTVLRPVIFVHGLDTSAATFLPNRDYFLQNGYADEELYATSYRPALQPLLTDKMTCQHVRLLIRSVHEFTNSAVDVIGYSMGSPISRKAIMGGACVDTGEQLGPNITNLIQTFIGVVGANFGAEFLCALPIESCNVVNGIVCNSLFLNDVNSRPRSGYEATNIYTIYTTADEVVGMKSCNGRRITSIPGEHNLLGLVKKD